jgi:hypothetical protein
MASLEHRLGRSDVQNLLNDPETSGHTPRQDPLAMCSQSDYLHDELPIGLGSPEPKGQRHPKRRGIQGPRPSLAVATAGTPLMLSSRDELTLRMIFGDR